MLLQASNAGQPESVNGRNGRVEMATKCLWLDITT
jgi:hypothetical protein